MAAAEGSKVRLVGLRNPDLNLKVGTISNYTPDGERVRVQLEGRQGLVKVKPKQIELLEGPAGGGRPGGGARPGLHRHNSSRSQNSSLSRNSVRSTIQDAHSGGARGGRWNQRKHYHYGFNQSAPVMTNRSTALVSGMRRVSSVGDYRDDDSVEMQRSSRSQDLFDALRDADGMFGLADTSKDGVISEKEFGYYMRKYTDHDEKTIRDCFLSVDVDGNGDITRDEVRTAFLKKKREGNMVDWGNALEEKLLEVSRDADNLFDRADINKDGSLSAREFELYMKKHTDHSAAVIHELFEYFDTNKDGFIDKEEVRKAVHALSKGKEGKMTLGQLLHLEDDQMAEIEDDVYNIFFLSETGSHAFWFAIIVFILKLALINIIVVDLYTVQEFPPRSEVSLLVKMAQFLLLPVNVVVQEELVTTFYVYANLEWNKMILELHPGGSKRKYHWANFMRLVDGLCFLFVNTTLLFQADKVVGAFLNFAALQFLSSIDNKALHLARDGYLHGNLEEVAKDVELMKLPKNSNNVLQVLDTTMLVVTYLICLVAWVLFTFPNIKLA